MKGWALAIFVAVASCGGGSDWDRPEVPSARVYVDSTSPTPAQAAALEALGPVTEAAFRPGTRDLSMLRGPALAHARGHPDDAAIRFVARYPALFSGASIRVDRVARHGGGAVVRASQWAGGRRVMAGALVFDFDAAGRLTQVAGSTRAVPRLPGAVLSSAAAEDLARRALEAELPGAEALVARDTEMVVARGQGAFLVTLEANPGDGPTRRAILVDDQRGAILGDVDTLALEGGPRGQRAPTDVGADTRRVFEALHALLGLDGFLDPLGDRVTPASALRAVPGPARMFWDGAQLVHGATSSAVPTGAGLGAVAHALAHGLIAAFSGPTGAGESGALGEGLADALAAMVRVQLGDGRGAWRVGQGPNLRDLAHPRARGEPCHMDGYVREPEDAAHDDGAIHRNATIVGHAFFLMSEGGRGCAGDRTIVGLGAARTAQVLLGALRSGLTSTADFAQCARATEASALARLGPSAARTVRRAWEAVGVRVPRDDLLPLHDAPQYVERPFVAERVSSRLARLRSDLRRLFDGPPVLALGARVRGHLAAGTSEIFAVRIHRVRDLHLAATSGAPLQLRVRGASGRVLARIFAHGGRAGSSARVQPGKYLIELSQVGAGRVRGVAYALSLR